MTRTTPRAGRRLGLALATIAFAASGLTACGGSDSGSGSAAPDDVSKDDFCSSYTEYFKELAKVGIGSGDNVVPAIKDFADKLSETGTPSDIPDDARRGFELSIDQAKDLPDDASLEDLSKLETDLSADDQKDSAAFGTYVQKTCPDLLSGLGVSPSPSS